jgi:hypothetical protein
MAKSSSPVLPQSPKISPVTLQNADGTSVKTAYTAGANDSKVVALSASNTDTAAYTVQVWLTRSATNYLLGAFPVAANAGNNGTVAAQNLLAPTLWPGLPVDNDGQVYLFLQSGDTLSAGVTGAVASGKTVTVTAIGADF